MFYRSCTTFKMVRTLCWCSRMLTLNLQCPDDSAAFYFTPESKWQRKARRDATNAQAVKPSHLIKESNFRKNALIDRGNVIKGTALSTPFSLAFHLGNSHPPPLLRRCYDTTKLRHLLRFKSGLIPYCHPSRELGGKIFVRLRALKYVVSTKTCIKENLAGGETNAA